MGHAGIDRNDQVELRDHGGRVGEIRELRAEQMNVPVVRQQTAIGLRDLPLEDDPVRVQAEQGRQLRQPDRAVVVVQMVGITRPDQTDPRSRPGRQPGEPLQPQVRVRRQIAAGGGDVPLVGVEQCGQAHQGGVEIEGRRLLVEADHGRFRLELAQQPDEGCLHGKDNGTGALGDQGHEARELQGVAEALLPVDEDRLAGQVLAGPVGLAVDALTHRLDLLLAPLVKRPPLREAPQGEERQALVEIGVRKVRIEADGEIIGLQCLLRTTHVPQDVADVAVRPGIVRIELDRAPVAVEPLLQPVQVPKGIAAIEVGTGHARQDGDRALIVRQRRLDPLQLEQGIAAIVVRLSRPGLEGDGGVERVQRRLVLLQAEKGIPPPEDHFRVGVPGGQGQIAGRQRLGIQFQRIEGDGPLPQGLRKIRDERQRLVEGRQRLGVAVQLQQGQALVDPGFGMARIQAAGLDEAVQGLFEAAEPHQRLGAVVMDLGTGRMDRKGPVKGREGLGERPLAAEHRPQVPVGLGEVGQQGKGRPIILRRVLQPPLVQPDIGPIAEGLGVVRLQPDRRIQTFGRLLETTEVPKGIAAVAVEIRLGRIDRDRRLDMAQPLGGTAGHEADHPLPVRGLGVVRIRRPQGGKGGLRLRETALRQQTLGIAMQIDRGKRHGDAFRPVR